MDLAKILASNPVNKQAALVTSQSGCVDDISCSAMERRKALASQKQHYSEMIGSLKKELGINRKWSKGQPLPPYIHKHKKFPLLVSVSEKLTEIDKEIVGARKEAGMQRITNFEVRFVEAVRIKYPEIFNEVKDCIFKEFRNEPNQN